MTKRIQTGNCTLGRAYFGFEVTGFPLKLAKADAGSQVTWIGASIETLDDLKATKVTIPKEKIEELLKTCETFMSRPVVGRRQLRSFAGALSFVAGVVPHVRPFLASLWAVVAQANDGQRTSGKLVHTRRIGKALNWIAAFLRGETCLTRTVRSHRPKSSAMVITDASTGPTAWVASCSRMENRQSSSACPSRANSYSAFGHPRETQNIWPCGRR